MNTDRFLTRVWDKQEKKIYYIGDKLPKSCFSDFIWKFNNGFKLLAINENCLIVIAFTQEDSQIQIFHIEYGDRFIPMLCSGSPDKNKKLIYTGDILEGYCVKGCEREKISGVMSFSEISFGFELNLFNSNIWDDKLYVPLGKLLPSETGILGNIHENPKLMEQNK